MFSDLYVGFDDRDNSCYFFDSKSNFLDFSEYPPLICSNKTRQNNPYVKFIHLISASIFLHLKSNRQNISDFKILSLKLIKHDYLNNILGRGSFELKLSEYGILAFPNSDEINPNYIYNPNDKFIE
jgi:hypothetical protein